MVHIRAFQERQRRAREEVEKESNRAKEDVVEEEERFKEDEIEDGEEGEGEEEVSMDQIEDENTRASHEGSAGRRDRYVAVSEVSDGETSRLVAATTDDEEDVKEHGTECMTSNLNAIPVRLTALL
jgi:hypothetical protein